MLSRNKKREYLHNTIEIYDLKEQTITVDETNPHQAVNAASVFKEGQLIVMGGSVKLKKNGSKIFTNKSHLYDINSGFWYDFAPLPVGKESKSILVDNTIYLIGGYGKAPLKRIESYDLQTGRWSFIGELPRAIESPGLANHNNEIYIFDSRRIYVFDVLDHSIREYKIDLDLHGATLLYHDAQLFIMGGYRLDNFTLKPSSQCFSLKLVDFLNTRIEGIQHL
jgi:hypothetical protein